MTPEFPHQQSKLHDIKELAGNSTQLSRAGCSGSPHCWSRWRTVPSPPHPLDRGGAVPRASPRLTRHLRAHSCGSRSCRYSRHRPLRLGVFHSGRSSDDESGARQGEGGNAGHCLATVAPDRYRADFPTRRPSATHRGGGHEDPARAERAQVWSYGVQACTIEHRQQHDDRTHGAVVTARCRDMRTSCSRPTSLRPACSSPYTTMAAPAAMPCGVHSRRDTYEAANRALAARLVARLPRPRTSRIAACCWTVRLAGTTIAAQRRAGWGSTAWTST